MSQLIDEHFGIIEGMLFLAGDEGLSLKDLRTILQVDETTCHQYLEEMKKELNRSAKRGIQLVFLAGKYKLATKQEYKPFFEKMVNQTSATLSNAALEVLAIIAYNQPVTRLRIEEIRGVGSDAMIRRLQAKALIREMGREDSPGKPILYGVTDQFMDTFNLASLDELPKLTEISSQNDVENIFDIKYQEDKEQII